MTHEIRPVTSLNGLWDFAFLGAIDLEAFAPADVGANEKMPVPSAFDALPAHAGRRGAAVYRRRFSVPAGRPARIEFGAVSLWTRVFVDGVLRREHACGYAPFAVEVPPATAAERELLVLVDNRFDFDRVPMHEEYFDFHQYGGILRDVALHVLPARGAFIEHVGVAPTAGYRDGGVEVTIELGGEATAVAALVTQIDSAVPQRHQNPCREGSRLVLALHVPAPRVWSPASPALHTLRIAIEDGRGTAGDDAIVRFGLRRIEARAGKLWLNGAPLKLRGYNRHEWHPNFGPCTPTLQMAADLQLLRDLGCNFVRGSHYPQDQRFLDLCDELGMLVWEENLGWGQRERTFASEKFRRDHLAALRAMVRASVNHPSVIIWGFLNEAGTDAGYVRPVLEETVATLRALDPTRLVSYASMFALTDRHFDLVDLMALNLYPGWYGCEGVEAPLELIAPFFRQCFAHLDAAGWAAKPVVISEIGAEALYGWRDAHGDFFTEEFQAEYLRRACVEALENPRCSGIALWHFSDARTYGGGWSLKRPRTFNNKGTFDEYRRPKAAAAAVRTVFKSHAPPPQS
ncbi:MAG TPA: glycoside hydrolase family 2 TIM barrel-domain containing protein [Opitutus sp.]|nr:glycoside hydrolase family 2 TIM barrel-domain containing protein [Opitutus sp.]